MLYHVSNIQGIKTLEPRISTHGKPYVYAIKDLVAGLLFGVRNDDFDFIISTRNDDKIEVYECYPNALEAKYKNQKCSVYELKEAGFKSGQTGWNAEFVCDTAVNVMNEFIVTDIYETLLNEEKKNNLIIHRYNNSLEYRRKISEHIVDRLIRFNALHHKETDTRFKKYYSNLISELEDVISGKYL
ncbi:hypothetical protein KQI89_17385 [Clostridium sp. MSJ-4]|uniref:DarT domain-containing protein n=1 Tax=Clostridium simiarum TaxID=2841506 RepID=A0ABS6F4S1_9CLOT|nr:hypothetical protein [Clostridium simiarum]MBU5593511.1 hypothetical protein [Clostridium simiarum]